jgi:hypothetical protein
MVEEVVIGALCVGMGVNYRHYVLAGLRELLPDKAACPDIASPDDQAGSTCRDNPIDFTGDFVRIPSPDVLGMVLAADAPWASSCARTLPGRTSAASSESTVPVPASTYAVHQGPGSR